MALACGAPGDAAASTRGPVRRVVGYGVPPRVQDTAISVVIPLRTRFAPKPAALLLKARYRDGRIALVAVPRVTRSRLAVCAVNLSGYGEHPGEGCVFAKSWGENEGMLRALQDGGVIGPVIRYVPAGFARAQECRLLRPDDIGEL